RIAENARGEALRRIEARVRELNSDVHIVSAVAGRVDRRLLYDVTDDGGETGQMSFRDLLVDEAVGAHDEHHNHLHASSVTVVRDGAVDPAALVDLLEQPPPGVYRMKGAVGVGTRHFLVNVVGTSVHVTTARAVARASHLVAIGTGFDDDEVRGRLEEALRPCPQKVAAAGMRRLQWLRQLSI
ncbi:GTP-binding protein, partial [Micromonospora sp. WMMD736]|uniref:GTP-binding protein n=1 Tax=Micromonospora sp. WMMD736 TaxID=3404112 RepID=UPI003B95DF67